MLTQMRRILAITFPLLLAACKPATQVPSLDRVYKVEEFDRDSTLRHGTLAACNSNPGQLMSDPNCVNATASKLGAGGEQDRADAARVAAAKQEIEVIEQGLKFYRLDNGAYPTQHQGLQALTTPAHGQTYIERVPADPWGHPYQFLNPGTHGEIDVYSYGASGTGTETVIGSWQ